jgi:O-antigen/teichoic acid export membrane protein
VTQTRSQSFAVNSIWNVLSFGLNVCAALVLSPVIIRHIGIEGYGVWVLVFSISEYVWISDLGLRSATLKYVAHHMARSEWDEMHRVLTVSFVYFAGIALLAAMLLLGLAPWLAGWLRIPAAQTDNFLLLMRLLGVTTAATLLANAAKASLEAVQDYKSLSRINMVVTATRFIGSLAVLKAGGALPGLGWITAGAMWLGFLLLGIAFRRRFPDFRLGRATFSRDVFKRLLGYGVHTMAGGIGMQILVQGPAVMLARWSTTAAVGYFSLPFRLLITVVDVIPQIGMVMGASSAKLVAEGEWEAIHRATTMVNRYCFALFLFPTCFLLVYGRELFDWWIGPELSARVAPLLPWLLLGFSLGTAAQQNSSAALYGIGAHGSYAWGLVAEGLLLAVLWWWILPRYDLPVAAAVMGGLIFINRGLRTSWLLCRQLSSHWPQFLWDVYATPLAMAAVLSAIGVGLRTVVPGHGLPGLVLAATILAMVYMALAARFIMRPEHREILWSLCQRGLKR